MPVDSFFLNLKKKRDQIFQLIDRVHVRGQLDKYICVENNWLVRLRKNILNIANDDYVLQPML